MITAAASLSSRLRPQLLSRARRHCRSYAHASDEDEQSNNNNSFSSSSASTLNNGLGRPAANSTAAPQQQQQQLLRVSWDERMVWRVKLGDWLRNVATHLCLPNPIHTALMAMCIADRALCSHWGHRLSQSDMQLLYITCMCVAAGRAGCNDVQLAAVRACATQYSGPEYQMMEANITQWICAGMKHHGHGSDAKLQSQLRGVGRVMAQPCPTPVQVPPLASLLLPAPSTAHASSSCSSSACSAATIPAIHAAASAAPSAPPVTTATSPLIDEVCAVSAASLALLMMEMFDGHAAAGAHAHQTPSSTGTNGSSSSSSGWPSHQGTAPHLLDALWTACREWETTRWAPPTSALACCYLALRASGVWDGQCKGSAGHAAIVHWLSLVTTCLHVDMVSVRDCAMAIIAKSPPSSAIGRLVMTTFNQLPQQQGNTDGFNDAVEQGIPPRPVPGPSIVHLAYTSTIHSMLPGCIVPREGGCLTPGQLHDALEARLTTRRKARAQRTTAAAADEGGDTAMDDRVNGIEDDDDDGDDGSSSVALDPDGDPIWHFSSIDYEDDGGDDDAVDSASLRQQRCLLRVQVREQQAVFAQAAAAAAGVVASAAAAARLRSPQVAHPSTTSVAVAVAVAPGSGFSHAAVAASASGGGDGGTAARAGYSAGVTIAHQYHQQQQTSMSDAATSTVGGGSTPVAPHTVDTSAAHQQMVPLQHAIMLPAPATAAAPAVFTARVATISQPPPPHGALVRQQSAPAMASRSGGVGGGRHGSGAGALPVSPGPAAAARMMMRTSATQQQHHMTFGSSPPPPGAMPMMMTSSSSIGLPIPPSPIIIGAAGVHSTGHGLQQLQQQRQAQLQLSRKRSATEATSSSPSLHQPQQGFTRRPTAQSLRMQTTPVLGGVAGHQPLGTLDATDVSEAATSPVEYPSPASDVLVPASVATTTGRTTGIGLGVSLPVLPDRQLALHRVTSARTCAVSTTTYDNTQLAGMAGLRLSSTGGSDAGQPSQPLSLLGQQPRQAGQVTGGHGVEIGRRLFGPATAGHSLDSAGVDAEDDVAEDNARRMRPRRDEQAMCNPIPAVTGVHQHQQQLPWRLAAVTSTSAPAGVAAAITRGWSLGPGMTAANGSGTGFAIGQPGSGGGGRSLERTRSASASSAASADLLAAPMVTASGTTTPRLGMRLPRLASAHSMLSGGSASSRSNAGSQTDTTSGVRARAAGGGSAHGHLMVDVTDDDGHQPSLQLLHQQPNAPTSSIGNHTHPRAPHQQYHDHHGMRAPAPSPINAFVGHAFPAGSGAAAAAVVVAASPARAGQPEAAAITSPASSIRLALTSPGHRA